MKPSAQCNECGKVVEDNEEDYRVCEVCKNTEPPNANWDDTGCPFCNMQTWIIPKCPDCGSGCDFLYSEHFRKNPKTGKPEFLSFVHDKREWVAYSEMPGTRTGGK